ncbi:NADPH-dependent F420 reductase [Motilibacter aurantiacus]|uniref:NADPH-dependent F420 reductase n=1 Tax=Motilibacter aurantiacus TaxID=2714955 RepID=UPI00140BCAE1|nr:NAD(P)-binding domain-containing protein [Motilibacter aurantiacus]NHC47433.1 NAD(P)-binding domain-containing protein [Motilibacter aurantiacus]
MKIAVLGSGSVGTTLAHGLLEAGHDVVFGVRAPGTHGGFSAPALTLQEAAAAAQVVVNALPGSVSLDVLVPLADALAGKVLVDVANAVTPAFDLLHPGDSLGAKLQQALPRTRVVKTLNTVPVAVMADPGGLPGPSSVFLSGNDAEAKRLVGLLLQGLGWAHGVQVDLGGISTARATEHYLHLSMALMGVTGGAAYNVAVVA